MTRAPAGLLDLQRKFDLVWTCCAVAVGAYGGLTAIGCQELGCLVGLVGLLGASVAVVNGVLWLVGRLLRGTSRRAVIAVFEVMRAGILVASVLVGYDSGLHQVSGALLGLLLSPASLLSLPILLLLARHRSAVALPPASPEATKRD